MEYYYLDIFRKRVPIRNMLLLGLTKIFYLVPSVPSDIQIEITTRCNLDCFMCPRRELQIAYEDMPVERFKRIIDRIYQPSWVGLTGWGEPFLHPRIFEMIEYAKNKGHQTAITTNGWFLKSNVGNILKSGLDFLAVSIEGVSNEGEAKFLGHPYNYEVLQGIENIARLRKEKGSLKVCLQITLHKNKKEDVLKVIEYGVNIGVDSISLLRLHIGKKDVERPTLEEEIEIYRDVETLGRKLDVRVDSIFSRFKGTKRFFYGIINPYLYRKHRYCQKTHDHIYITLAGDIVPCCHLLNNKMGNILGDGVFKIWNSEKFKSFRKRQQDYCVKCDVHTFRFKQN